MSSQVQLQYYLYYHHWQNDILSANTLTTIKQIVFNICNTFNEHSGVNHFLSVEKLAEVLGKLRKFDSIDSYDFPTLYTTLPHKLIKHKFSYLIKWEYITE
jgi:hypothetical protein